MRTQKETWLIVFLFSSMRLPNAAAVSSLLLLARPTAANNLTAYGRLVDGLLHNYNPQHPPPALTPGMGTPVKLGLNLQKVTEIDKSKLLDSLAAGFLHLASCGSNSGAPSV